jgi:SAM-dependent methyltransferase
MESSSTLDLDAPMPGLDDSSRHSGSVRKGLELFCLSFIALFLELMVIRWAPSVVRLVAYYANLMLISSFLGLGVGAMIGRSRKSMFPWLLALLAGSVGFLLLAQYATLPSTEGERRFYGQVPQLINYLSLVGIFVTNAIVFLPLGQRIGAIFEQLPPLQAYSWDLGGSLAGTLSFGLFSLTHFSPALGMGFVALSMLALTPRRHWYWGGPLLVVVTLCVMRSNDPNAIWSPYYHITVREASTKSKDFNERTPALRDPRPGLGTMEDPPAYLVSVNHDFYQPHMTMDPKRYSPGRQASLAEGRVAYDLPYSLSAAHRRVLVLGAGGGTDTEVAVLNGAEHVDAVEIDPMLVKLSGKFNPSDVYRNPRVSVHVDDARAYLRRAGGGYDMVVFGWLDSQALFSSMSNLRLDGYIYTVESMQSAYRLLQPNGSLSVSFMAGPDWMARKLFRMVAEATGKTPFTYQSGGQVIIVAPRGEHPDPPAQFGRFVRREFGLHDQSSASEPPRDDWPFLYLSGRQIPPDYMIVIALLMMISLPTVYAIRGEGMTANDGHFLFLGLGFLLLETKSIGDCSLYFGTTWFVTMVVVAGVLLMVLVANLVAMRLAAFNTWMYVPLFASLVLVALVGRDAILSLTFTERLLWSLLVIPLPIFFAGLIFSTTFRETANPSALFGANLIGAMIGGFCEYLGMRTGNSKLMVVVIAAYLLSLTCRMWISRAPVTGLLQPH